MDREGLLNRRENIVEDPGLMKMTGLRKKKKKKKREMSGRTAAK